MFKNPDFTKIAFQEASRAESRAAWEQRVLKETGHSVSELCTRTMEQIEIDPLYTAANYEGMNHLNFMAGLPPFLRRLLHCRGVERVLSPQPGRRSEGPVHRLRPCHAPRL